MSARTEAQAEILTRIQGKLCAALQWSTEFAAKWVMTSNPILAGDRPIKWVISGRGLELEAIVDKYLAEIRGWENSGAPSRLVSPPQPADNKPGWDDLSQI